MKGSTLVCCSLVPLIAHDPDPTHSLTSVLTCPVCQHAQIEQMPTDACQWFCKCTNCNYHTVLKLLAGDCCVYCSYGSGAARPSKSKAKAPAANHNQSPLLFHLPHP